MKLLGLSAGARNGNSEILLKEAIMGAEEMGVEHEIIRLLDLDIRSCQFCKVCVRNQGKPCIVKDDVPFIQEKLLECDGLIIAAPVYILTPPGFLKMLADRTLADLAGEMMMAKSGLNPFTKAKAKIDKRSFKRRVGGLISQGGATTPHWIGLGLPILYANTFPRQIEIVDQMEVLGANRSILKGNARQRARKLGRNVGEAMVKLAGKTWDINTVGDIEKQAIDRPKWRGDIPGTCPVCHTNLLLVGKTNPVECAVCGSKGVVKVSGKNITVTFSKQEREESRLTIEGKRIHQEEIRNNMLISMGQAAEYEKLKAKYAKYGNMVKPPKKSLAKK